jgi:ribosomal protein S18 acetylase RimI-like enzyme
MEIRLSSLGDIPRIMTIIKDAQTYLAVLKIDQWQDGYPNVAQIELDIKNDDSYIVLNRANEIIGTTVFTTKKERAYQNIDGNWITPETATYGVIHRLAVGEEFRKSGLAKFVFDACESRLKAMKINSMRIDTHRENQGMQYLLKKRGYHYCGVILLESGDERLAFEKIMND